jgi:hypothetical protein
VISNLIRTDEDKIASGCSDRFIRIFSIGKDNGANAIMKME